MEKIAIISGACIYFLYSETEIVYIGSTYELTARIGEHQRSKKVFTHYTYKMYDKVSPKQLLSIEAKLIKKHKPKYNKVHKDKPKRKSKSVYMVLNK